MAGGVSLPSVLQLLDGTPHKKVASAIFEKLPLAKVLSGGNVGGLMQSVLQGGGLQSVMQNPMGALTGALQGQLGGLVGQLQGMAGGGPQGLISALMGSAGAGGLLSGGLGQALGAFQAAGDNLAGLTNGASGFFGLLGHGSLVDMLGPQLPAALGLDRVLGPIASGAVLQDIAGRLPEVVQAVVAGQMAPAAATAWVQGRTDALDGIVQASAYALAQGQAIQPLVSTVAAVSGALAMPGDAAGPSSLQTALGTLVQPDARAAMDAALAEQIRAEHHDPVDTKSLTSLED